MESTIWDIAFELARRDAQQTLEILALKANIVNKEVASVLPIAIYGPSNLLVVKFVAEKVLSVPVLNHVCRLFELAKKIGPIEMRISWVNGAFTELSSWFISQFDSAFKNSPSALNFTHMATTVRLMHRILEFLDVGFMCLLECPDPDKASTMVPSTQIITIANWPFPPKHVDPVKKWNPAAWPKWRLWPEQVHAPPSPHTLSTFVKFGSPEWIGVNQAQNSLIIHGE